MGIELATGYVSISASTVGLGAQIDREMRGVQSKGASYGRGLGEQVKRGFESAKPVDTKQVEQSFTDAEKRREAVVKRTADTVDAARRKEQIATAKLAETEKKYAADSSQVLAAKDRLVAASQKVKLEEAKQSVAVEKATRDVADAKKAVDDLSSAKDAAASKSRGLAARIGDAFRGIGRDAGNMGREVGDSFAKVGKGDFRSAFSGLKSAFGITRREGRTAGTDTGLSFSRGIAHEMGAAGTKAGSVFMGTLKGVLGAQVISKVVGGVMGTIKGAFQGGFNRVMSIQEAEIKLGTIFEGDAAKIKTAMKAVGDAVDGTKFAISDAADMAAQLGAAGVQAGKPMEVWLSRTADAAQFAGREFTDMQAIIGKVVATGRVTGETFEQLPLAAAALSDHLGVSQAEVRKLASDGKISAEQFGEAMDKKIGGAARNAGGSFLSMIANIKSAMNATGAKLLKPVTDALMPIAGVGLTLMKGFRDNVAGPMGESLSGYLQPRAEAFAESLKKLPGFFAGVKSGFAGIKSLASEVFGSARDAVAGFVDGFGDIGSLGAAIGPVISLLSGPLGLLKAVLGDLMKGLNFKEVGASFGSAVRPVIDSAVQMYGVFASAAIGIAQQLVPVLSNIAKSLLPVLTKTLQEVAPVFGRVVAAVAPLVGQLVSQLAPALAGIVAAVLPVVSALVKALAPIVISIATNVLPPLVSALTTLAGIISSVVVPAISAVLMPVITMMGRLVSTVFGFVASTISNAMKYIAGVIKVVTSVISGDWSGAWQGIKQMASAVWEQIKNVVRLGINLVKDTVLNVMGALTGNWSATWEGIKNVGSRAWTWIKNGATSAFKAIGDAVSGFGKVWDSVWGGLKKAAAVPVNFVINTVWNDGLRNIINFVTKQFDGPHYERVPDIKFDRGGILPGQSSYRDGDDQIVSMRRGEGVTVSEALRDPYERQRLLELNKASIRGMSPARWREQYESHAKGGIIGSGLGSALGGGGRSLTTFHGKTFTQLFARTLAVAERLAGAAFRISQGGFRPRTSYSGTSHQGDAVDLTPVTSRNVAALRAAGVAAWDRTGKGNWAPHIHGVPLPGRGYAGGSAVAQAQSYLRGGDGLGGRDNGPRVGLAKGLGGMVFNQEVGPSVFDIPGMIKDVLADVAKVGGSPFGKMISQAFSELTNKVGAWAQKKLGQVAQAAVENPLVDAVTGTTREKTFDKSKMRKLPNMRGKGYADGTLSAAPGAAWVGERGPELVDFGAGGQRVYDAGTSAAIAGGIHIDHLSIDVSKLRNFADLEAFIYSLPQVRAQYAR